MKIYGTKGADKRKLHGSKGSTVFRDPNEADRVWAIFDWDLEGWGNFASDPEVPAIMQEAGHKGRPQVGSSSAGSRREPASRRTMGARAGARARSSRLRGVQRGGPRDARRALRRERLLAHARPQPGRGRYLGRDAVFARFGRYARYTGGTFRADLKRLLTDEDGNVVGIHHTSGERNGKELDAYCCVVFEVATAGSSTAASTSTTCTRGTSSGRDAARGAPSSRAPTLSVVEEPADDGQARDHLPDRGRPRGRREGLRLSLSRAPTSGSSVRRPTASGVALAERRTPDVVIMDVRMPGMDGLEATKILTEQAPETRVLIFTAYSERSLLAAGSSRRQGLHPQEAPHETLVRAIDKVAAGEAFVDPALMTAFLTATEHEAQPARARDPPAARRRHVQRRRGRAPLHQPGDREEPRAPHPPRSSRPRRAGARSRSPSATRYRFSSMSVSEPDAALLARGPAHPRAEQGSGAGLRWSLHDGPVQDAVRGSR